MRNLHKTNFKRWILLGSHLKLVILKCVVWVCTSQYPITSNAGIKVNLTTMKSVESSCLRLHCGDYILTLAKCVSALSLPSGVLMSDWQFLQKVRGSFVCLLVGVFVCLLVGVGLGGGVCLCVGLFVGVFVSWWGCLFVAHVRWKRIIGNCGWIERIMMENKENGHR